MRLFVISALVVVAGAAAAGRQTPRDNSAEAPAGASAISGVVVTDETPPRVVRRAIVTLALPGGGRGSAPSAAVTDDEGKFAFEALPAGRYTLTASKPSYVNGAYGATRPARPGTPIQLAAGQQLRTATITLTRGAVVTGTVRDQNGEPMPSTRVTLLRYVFQPQNGERVLQPQGPGGTTDDRGMYRIYGVAPGEYYAQLESPFTLPGDLRQTTDQSMQSAILQLRAPAGAAPVAQDAQPRSIGYAPVFFPSATSAEAAVALRLAAGEERGGVDIQFQPAAVAKIEGVVLGPDGGPSPTAQVTILGAGAAPTSLMSAFSAMFGGGRPNPEGRFTLSGITPGRYTIAATTGGSGRGRGAAPSANATPALWATAEVEVNGQDVSGLRLALEPGMRVAGRIGFDGSTPPQDLANVRISLTPILSGSSVAVLTQPVDSDAQGRFVIENVTPGRYRWGVTSPPGAGAWTLKSAVARTRETIDAGLDVRPNEPVSDVILTMSDRPTTLQGTLQDTAGRAASEYFIVVYARDRALQTPPTRRVSMARPGSDGSFTLRDLPPGDYLIAAVTDIEQGEWRDPAFLAQLVPASIPVTLAEGETKRQDITIRTP